MRGEDAKRGTLSDVVKGADAPHTLDLTDVTMTSGDTSPGKEGGTGLPANAIVCATGAADGKRLSEVGRGETEAAVVPHGKEIGASNVEQAEIVPAGSQVNEAAMSAVAGVVRGAASLNTIAQIHTTGGVADGADKASTEVKAERARWRTPLAWIKGSRQSAKRACCLDPPKVEA